MQEVKGSCIQLSDRQKVTDFIKNHLQPALDMVESHILKSGAAMN
jgi:hypothetical protein